MNILTPWIRRTYRNELLKAESNGFDRADKLAKVELQKALNEQRDMYELQLISKDNDISALEKTISYMERQVDDAGKKIRSAKEIYIEAKKIVTRAEMAYKRHAENETRVMSDFREIRNSADKFEQKLIGE